jgi:hypothetical protein
MMPGKNRFRLAIYAALTMLTVTLTWTLVSAANHVEAFV